MSKIRISVLAVSLILSVEAFGQHDPGRNAVRLLGKGETDSAVKLASKGPSRMNSPISDAERHFVLAMAACRQGDSAGAFKHAKQAVDMGLPVERLQAGPRDFLKPLYAHSEFKTWLAGRRRQLLHGPLVGSVTDSSASFWVRTAGEADVRIVVKRVTRVKTVATNKSDVKPLAADGRTSAKSDYTAAIGVSGLAADTRYRYEVEVGGKAVAAAEFRTFPRRGSPGRFRIAFGGGAGFTPGHERMWTTLGKQTRAQNGLYNGTLPFGYMPGEEGGAPVEHPTRDYSNVRLATEMSLNNEKSDPDSQRAAYITYSPWAIGPSMGN